MQSVGIKDLQTNPAVMTRSLERDEFVLITKRGKPLGIAAHFEDQFLTHEFRDWISIKAYEQGDLSLGQLGEVLGRTRSQTLELLGVLGIATADYDLSEDLETIEALEK